MFDRNKNARDRDAGLPPAPPPSQAAKGRGSFSVLGPDVTITGNVSASADLHIDGRVDGDVNCGTLVLGPESRINGSVRADLARIGGTIEGSVSVRQLTVERNAKISGDVEYETISIENGAHIDGRLKHSSAALTPASNVFSANDGGSAEPARYASGDSD